MPRYCESPVIGTEQIFFFSVEIYTELFCIGKRSETGFPVLGLEIIMIVRNVTYEIECPTLVGSP